MYLFCFIDRANIGNARLAGLEKELGLKGYDYNLVLTVFYISYIIFELPSNLCCKWLGPGWFIPGLTLSFGVASIGTAFVDTKAEICAVRFVLGIFEAGMLPGIAYYMTRWYVSRIAYRIIRLRQTNELPPGTAAVSWHSASPSTSLWGPSPVLSADY